MKKIFILILAISCTLTFFSTFSNANSKTIEKYVYAQDWNYNIKWQDTPAEFENDIYTNINLDKLLKTCKSDYILANLKSTYPYLAWDNFENVQIYESELENSEDVAMYLKSKNIIIVNKPVFTKTDYITQYNCILHELAHSLTLSDNSILSGGFNEPVAEFMAYKVCENQSIDFEFSYKDVSTLYMLISNAYGDDELIYDFYNGLLIENLNQITDNNANQLASILYFLEHPAKCQELPFSYDYLIMMAQDIAIHANINTQKSLENFSEHLIINNDYFSNLISRNL